MKNEKKKKKKRMRKRNSKKKKKKHKRMKREKRIKTHKNQHTINNKQSKVKSPTCHKLLIGWLQMALSVVFCVLFKA